MAILITGGAGYIGLHTAVALMEADRNVILVDNFSNSSHENVKRAEQITGGVIPTFEADVADAAALERVFWENDIEAVIHCAGFKAVGESCEQPLKYYRNNLDTTLTLLETMRDYGVKRVVFSSSSTVYGINGVMPLHEDAPTGCVNPYGWTKLMIERIFRDAAAADPSLSVVLLRYFNPAGAHESGLIGEDPKGVPNNLMPYVSLVAAGRLPQVNVYGGDWPTKDGTGVRDYIHIMDLAEGHIAAVDYTETHTGCETVNLGTGTPYSVLEVIEAYGRVSGRKIPYQIVGRRPGDIAECFASPEKAERLLHWRAARGLDDMCRDDWKWRQHAAE
ncbi:MAG: UDP-glucose 4-epimerase GalE [Oscillospiraceae bacterium]|nr:UDP-glucose 4-epimerase GalE [Oscillospiraceae bacterium]